MGTKLINKSVLVDAKGRKDSTITMTFEKGADATISSCSLTYRNRFYVFGGHEDHLRQISEVAQCSLRRIGSLTFDHREGACSNVGDRKLYLCFGQWSQNTNKKCRSAAKPLGEFIDIELSEYDHDRIKTAASTSNFQVIFYLLIIFSRVTRSWKSTPGKCQNGDLSNGGRPLEDAS